MNTTGTSDCVKTLKFHGHIISLLRPIWEDQGDGSYGLTHNRFVVILLLKEGIDMPRIERIASTTSIYHTMLRGINHQLIFKESEDFTKFLSILSEVKKLSGFTLYAYCLMGNHVHLLLKEGKEPIAQIFKRIGARYVFWFNWKYGRSGHLFQDRFKSEPVETDDYFITVLLYIYQNPVKAGICKRPQDYVWSSLRRIGKSEIADDDALFEIVPLELIKLKECEEIDCDILEPKFARGRAMTDEAVLTLIKSFGNVTGVSGFQSLSREKQSSVIDTLQGRGASMRQIARVSGLSRGLIARLCRKGDAT